MGLRRGSGPGRGTLMSSVQDQEQWDTTEGL